MCGAWGAAPAPGPRLSGMETGSQDSTGGRDTVPRHPSAQGKGRHYHHPAGDVPRKREFRNAKQNEPAETGSLQNTFTQFCVLFLKQKCSACPRLYSMCVALVGSTLISALIWDEQRLHMREGYSPSISHVQPRSRVPVQGCAGSGHQQRHLDTTRLVYHNSGRSAHAPRG